MGRAAPPTGRETRWQRSCAEAIVDLDELLGELGLDGCPGLGSESVREACRRLPLLVPRDLVSRMRYGDPDDPLLRQVLPSALELDETVGFTSDPLAECRLLAADGTLQKYRGRMLLAVTSGCAIHCRYCFRREQRLSEDLQAVEGFGPALTRIASDPEIEEVILSGGDPLTVDDVHLAALARDLSAIQHLKRLRVHTRMPVVLPERVGDGLLAWLGEGRLQSVLVIHANHPREIDGRVQRALAALGEAAVVLLNQSVLLRGVNDDPGTLADLSRRLFECGVLPYYLHLLDRVRGAAHFEVSEPIARRLVEELAANLPGYLVPRLVRELPGASSKLAVSP